MTLLSIEKCCSKKTKTKRRELAKLDYFIRGSEAAAENKDPKIKIMKWKNKNVAVRIVKLVD